jgi:tetratricopeptide (TPR) repeat protein
MNQRYEEAEGYFREAMKHDPQAYSPVVNLGAALLSLGKLAESLELNQRAVEMQPSDPLAHSQLGQCAFAMGDLVAAETSLTRAKSLDPVHFSYPQLVLAEICRLRNDLACVVRELEDFLRHHPDYPESETLRAIIRDVQEKLDQEQ